MAKSSPFGINFDPSEVSEYAVPEEFRVISEIDALIASDPSDTFTVLSDSGEVLEYVVPQDYLETPEGSDDIVAAMDLLTRRHTSGFEHSGVAPVFSRPGNQMLLV